MNILWNKLVFILSILHIYATGSLNNELSIMYCRLFYKQKSNSYVKYEFKFTIVDKGIYCILILLHSDTLLNGEKSTVDASDVNTTVHTKIVALKRQSMRVTWPEARPGRNDNTTEWISTDSPPVTKFSGDKTPSSNCLFLISSFTWKCFVMCLDLHSNTFLFICERMIVF